MKTIPANHKVIPIYMQIRVLVSSYLFLTGFGHFTFFWKKGEYSLFRCSQVRGQRSDLDMYLSTKINLTGIILHCGNVQKLSING